MYYKRLMKIDEKAHENLSAFHIDNPYPPLISEITAYPE